MKLNILKNIPKSTLICGVVMLLAILALAVTVIRCGSEEKRLTSAIQETTDLPDLKIQKIDRISGGQWRVLLENVGRTCTSLTASLVVTPFYALPAQAMIRPEEPQAASIPAICPNNKTIRVFNFPAEISEKGDNGKGAHLSIHHIIADVNPAPYAIKESNTENNSFTQQVP